MARFHRLEIYHLAITILREIHKNLDRFKGHSSLRDQMKRASISTVSNICEGSERGTDREFKQFLRIARASNSELDGQWNIASALGLIPDGRFQAVLDQIDHLGRMLSRFIDRLGGTG